MSDGSWQPQTAHVAALVQILSQAGNPDNETQRQVQCALNEFWSLPDSLNYLAHVFACLGEEAIDVRQRAGLILKNKIRVLWEHLSPRLLDDVKQKLLSVVADPNKAIRMAAGSAITTVILKGGAEGWPHALQMLTVALDDPRQDVVHGAFSALCKVCEDKAEGMRYRGDEQFYNFVSTKLFPTILPFLVPKARTVNLHYSLQCINYFAAQHAFDSEEPFHSFLVPLWQSLCGLTSVEDPIVRREVCLAMISLASGNMDMLLESKALPIIVEFMLMCSSKQPSEIKKAAAEFWSLLFVYEKARAALRPVLPRLIAVLLDNTVYIDEDFCEMDPSQLEDDNSAVPDEVHDIQPRFHNQRRSEGDTEGVLEEDNKNNSSNSQQADDDNDEDAPDIGRGAWGQSWTLRKASAFSLDQMASYYRAEVLDSVLRPIEERLRSPEWKIRESAVLCLGAIAQGCLEGLNDVLPGVIELLILLCQDDMPLIRSISSWCLSRFACWICSCPNSDRFFKPVLAAILTRVGDGNKRVQEAACSAFATIEEEARDLLVPFLGDIINSLAIALKSYQARNLLILCDAVGTLAEAVGPQLCRQDFKEHLLVPLLELLRRTQNSEMLLVPLLESLKAITTALGEDMVPYMQTIVERCLDLVKISLEDIKRWKTFQNAERPQRDRLEAALDTFGTIVEVLNERTPQLLQTHDFLPYLSECCADHAMTVQQSSFALVGDVVGRAKLQIKPHLGKVIPELISHLLHSSISVCNNASWAIGEISLHLGNEVMAPYADEVATQLITLLSRTNAHQSLLCNACITLGRLGAACPLQVAPRLDEFLNPWCSIMTYARNDQEKMNGFHGIGTLIRLNPQPTVAVLPLLLHSLASITQPPETLAREFHEILSGMQREIPDKFEAALLGLHEDTRNGIVTRFGVVPTSAVTAAAT